jgi:hypothetical protein
MAALPHAEKAALKIQRQLTSARTTAVKERKRPRSVTLLSEGKEQFAAKRREYYSKYSGSIRGDWRA